MGSENRPGDMCHVGNQEAWTSFGGCEDPETATAMAARASPLRLTRDGAWPNKDGIRPCRGER